jgi:cell volume regulation protein A
VAIEQIILTVALLLLLSVGAAYASGRFGVPALVLFLAIGMLAGVGGPGGIEFTSASLAQSVGVVALLFILYSGGLDTSWPRIRPVLVPGLVLANVGVVISAALMGFFGVYVLGLTLLEGMLLGAIVSSTDAAAVFSILRMQRVRLRGRLEPLIELESGTNDPVAVLLTVGMTQLLIAPETSGWSLLGGFVWQMAAGAAGGYVAGHLIVRVINRVRLSQEGLYSVLSVALVLLAFGLISLLAGNGFLAVYVAGVVVGHHRVVHKGTIVRFHDGIAWLMQIAMFLTLGLLVLPAELPGVAVTGLAAALFLTLVARPISVVLSLFWARFSGRELAVISWAGLRGAVPIVLATFPLLAGVERSSAIFNVVFFVVVVSVLVQGTTLGPVARWLGLNPPLSEVVDESHAASPHLHAELIAATVPRGAACASKPVFDLGLPAGVLVVQIHRGSELLTPSGSTILEPGDHLMIMGDEETPGLLEDLGFTVRAVSPAMSYYTDTSAVD